jgi:hypothetical protein
MGELGDLRVRLATFQWLGEQVAAHGDVLARPLLAQGFVLPTRLAPSRGAHGAMRPPERLFEMVDLPYNDEPCHRNSSSSAGRANTT